MAPASLWAGHNQPSWSLRLMITSCALCLLRGAQCRQSAVVQRCSAAHLAGPKLPVGASWPQQACGLVTASPAGLRHMSTSCALCLLRGARCRQSAGVLSSTASSCHHSKAASGCLMAPASLWAGHCQPSRSLRLMTTSCAQAVRCGAEMSSCSSGWIEAAKGCLMAPASLWAGRSQPSRSLRPMTTSCALCLLRGARCRQSAGVLSSTASACHHSKAASGCLMAPASLWAGHSQPSRSLRPMTTSCALCLLRGARCRQSAGMFSSTASSCHHSKAASGCLMAPASLWV